VAGAIGSTTSGNNTSAENGVIPGGGAGGAFEKGGTARTGNAGGAGEIILTYLAAASQLQVVLPGQTVVAGSVSGTPTVQAVGVPFSVTINAVDANGYLVTNATPTVNFTSSDGAASLPANGSTTLVNGTATVSVTLNTGGSQTVKASDQANILTANTSSSVTVAQAPILETAPTASAITYGQALSASVLSGGACTNAAGAAVSGNFAFTTPATVPGAGTANQSVTFTPTDMTDYTTISFNVSVTVNQATPLLQTAPTASAIYLSQALSASVLSGGACTNATGAAVPGNFAFTTPTATPGLGTANQSVTFTPTDSTDYRTISLNVSVTVGSFTNTTLTTSSTSPWTVPPGVTAITVQMWGGGGGGGGVSVSTSGSFGAGGGGGGGAFTTTTLTGLTPGSTIAFSVGGGGVGGTNTGPANGGAGTNTTFAGATTANGGGGGGGTSTAGVVGTAGSGGTASSPGFGGGNGDVGSSTTSGGGGGSGGTNAAGNNASGATGGAAVPGGGAGAAGLTGSAHANGNVGGSPGGGGSGGFESNGTTLRTGGAGGDGQIVILNVVSAPQPGITGVSLSGTNLLINGTNGIAGTYVVLMNTNLSTTNWTPVATNTLSGSGSFSFTATNAVNTNAAQQFYILQAP
jgi:hypothetical protein